MRKQKIRKWVKLIDLDDNSCIRIVYNPYNKPAREIKEMWIPSENLKRVKAIKIT